MKKIILLFYILTFLQNYGCSPILKTIAGIKDIRFESINELKNFCSKNEIDMQNAFIKRPEQKFDYPDSSQINFRFADQVLVFNKQGNRIIYNGEGSGNNCSLPNTDFFSGLNSIFLPVDSINNLRYMLAGYRNIVTGDLPKVDSADYYLVYYWAKWYKSFSKKRIKEIKSILKNADKEKTIQCFYLNNDFVRINYPKEIEFKRLKVDVSL